MTIKRFTTNETVITNPHNTVLRGKSFPSLTIEGEKDEKIEIPFPKEKFTRLLKVVGVKNAEELSTSVLTKLMVLTIGDFITGAMSLDELATIFSFLLWNCKYKSGRVNPTFDEIGIILENGGELAYYLRHAVDNGEPNSTFVEFLYSLMQFYDRRAVVQANVESMEKERA